MNRARPQIIARPQRQLSWLSVPAILFAGAAAAGPVYGRSAWIFAAAFVLMALDYASDALVFDGERLQRRGLWAVLGELALGRKRGLALEEIETVSGLTTFYRRPGRTPDYQVVISGAGCQWVINSRRAGHRDFLKALLGAISPNKIDPRASELLTYWQESQQLKRWDSGNHSPALAVPPRLWRRLANGFALNGQFDVAARYFHLAQRQDPKNAHLWYEIGRFFRWRATTEKQSPADAPKGAASRARRTGWRQRRFAPSAVAFCSQLPAHYSRRAEACLRLAGQLGRADAALLERIGETFFEVHNYRLARRYFEGALSVSPHRLRANIGLAEVALRSGQAARAAHFYRTAARLSEEEGDLGLARLAERRGDYYARLLQDERFLDSEMARLSLLDNLKWARRGALGAFLLTWFVHLTCDQFAPAVQALSREISATSAILWVSMVAASYFFSQRRN